MPSTETLSSEAGEVTLGLVDGSEEKGFTPRFAPLEPRLLLVPRGRAGPAAEWAVERVAYLAFHVRESPPGAAFGASVPVDPRSALKLHVAGGRSFVVDLTAIDQQGSAGFYARPIDPDSPFRRIFFYDHAIKRRELNERLGEMLVREGRVGADQLARGLETQRGQRIPIGQILIEQRRLDPSDVAQAAAQQSRRGLKLGEVLVQAGLARPEDIDRALAEQRRLGGKRIGQILAENKLVSELDLSMMLARKFNLPFVDLDTCSINARALEAVPREIIEREGILPVDCDERSLTVALSDPLSVDLIDSIRFSVKKAVLEVVATQSQIDRYIRLHLGELDARRNQDAMPELIKTLAADDATEQESEEARLLADSDNTIIRLANQLIVDAYRRGASDIHVEPNGREQPARVRFRIDGECVEYQQIPAAYRQPLVARLKIMASLDIAERRKPQDGKIRLRIGQDLRELRVATIPTANDNEDVVLRLLGGSRALALHELGLSQRNLRELEKVVQKTYGLILCVGPTGSGKTTTLHSLLGSLNTPDRKIWTAEDPVEITQPGLRQVQVNPKIGVTFSSAMRAFLRADPDVIMVGEMRDVETARTALEASLTGHLVASTLHTNSAAETVTRLVEIGLDPFSFADSLLAVLAQRLARALCWQCSAAREATEGELASLAQYYGAEAFRAAHGGRGAKLELRKPAGCTICGYTGYKGRIGIHELLVSDPPLRSAIQGKATVADIQRLACAAGMKTLLQDGIDKVLAGETDLKQVLAACG